jgi:hypothetical protein
MDFQKGEVVEWTVQDRRRLLLTRRAAPAAGGVPARRPSR